MNPVVHFEMPYEDAERAAKFYESAFGWKLQMTGPEMGNYLLATTTDSDENGPKSPGAINGGFFAKDATQPAAPPSIVIAVDDITSAVEKIKSAGGAILNEPMDIPGVGKFITFTDSEGNRGGALEPLPRS